MKKTKRSKRKLPKVDIVIEEKAITAKSKRMKLPPGHAKALREGLMVVVRFDIPLGGP